MKRDEIKLKKGLTDAKNIFEHLGEMEKQSRKDDWMKKRFSKQAKLKGDDHD